MTFYHARDAPGFFDPPHPDPDPNTNPNTKS